MVDVNSPSPEEVTGGMTPYVNSPSMEVAGGTTVEVNSPSSVEVDGGTTVVVNPPSSLQDFLSSGVVALSWVHTGSITPVKAFQLSVSTRHVSHFLPYFCGFVSGHTSDFISSAIRLGQTGCNNGYYSTRLQTITGYIFKVTSCRSDAGRLAFEGACWEQSTQFIHCNACVVWCGFG